MKYLPITVLALSAAVFPAAYGRTPPAGNVVDLKRFTINGAGLSSSAEEIIAALGRPDEEQLLSGSAAEKERVAQEKAGPVEKRLPESVFDRVVYAYFNKGIKVVFRKKDMRIEKIVLYVQPSPPYGALQGSIEQGLPLEVRQITLLKKYARQLYKDAKGMFALKKDDRSAERETAVLAFSPEGWLRSVTFLETENLQIDIDKLCVAGICLGGDAEGAPDLLGPPDSYVGHGGRYSASWQKEGIRIEADKSKKINAIRIDPGLFDGGFVQPLTLVGRKQAFHDYLGSRIYMEGVYRICAYREGEALGDKKVVLDFDEDDRLSGIFFNTIGGVEVDLRNMSAGGVRVGDSAKQIRKLLGECRRWRETRESIVLGYPACGLRLTMTKIPPPSGASRRSRSGAVPWGEVGRVKKAELVLEKFPWAYCTPFSFADDEEAYKKKAGKYIFREKDDTLYVSKNGRAPDPGVAALIVFDRTGWPISVTLKQFRNLLVDMKAFTVAGIGLGTHADEVYRILGRPQRSHHIKKENLTVIEYVPDGIVMVIDPLNRAVCKMVLDMEKFEGDFAQDVSVDSDADEFEKALHAEIYKQDGKRLCFTPDGKKPVWEEGQVSFGLSGDVEKLSFFTLGVKREGILLDITKELE